MSATPPKKQFELAGHSLEFVCIPSGRFLMGSSHGLPLELPTRDVQISNPFWIGSQPISQDVWNSVVSNNPSTFSYSPHLPVDGISFDDAIAFCRMASEITGHSFSLPTEAQWEFACRAGTTSEYFWGDSAERSGEFGWFDMNANGKTHEVGVLQPNPWGLYDIVGNLWEWCQDVWHSDYDGAPNTDEAWMTDEALQPRRCLRGGAWDVDAFRLRSAYRSFDHKVLGTSRFGIRVVINS